MKNNITSLIIAFAFITLFTNCGSKKGQWSEADKKTFDSEMATVDLTKFGENKTKWLDCYYKKMEANYGSFALADNDVEGCKKLALECSEEVLSNGSVKGKWSDADKQTYYSEMAKVDLSQLGEYKTAWLECYLQKVEQNYSCFVMADSDEKGCEKIAVECSEEISKQIPATE